MVCPAGHEIAAGLDQIAHDDRRQPLERLVEQQDLRFAYQARVRSPASAVRRRRDRCRGSPAFLEPRKHRVDAVERPAVGAVSPARTRFSSTFRLPKMRRSSGTSCMPRCAIACAGLPAIVVAVEHDRARARAHQAHQALERRALAGAIASEQRHHFVAPRRAATRRTGCG